MKKLILFALICLPGLINAQSRNDTIKTTGNGFFIQKTGEYIAANGDKFRRGDFVKIGPATGANGSYKFLSIGSFLGAAVPLTGGWDGSRFKIKAIEFSGAPENGQIAIFKLSNSHSGKYLCTIDAALKSGEIEAIKRD